ncbi:MAG: TIGR02147 family protein [Bdellovibrionota bacterium]
MLLDAGSYRQFLNEELSRRLRANPQYSQRAFAKQLRMSPGEISEILKGKRRLSLKGAVRVSTGLGLNPTEAKYLLYLIQREKAEDAPERNPIPSEEELLQDLPKERTLGLDIFRVVSDWHHFAILNLFESEYFEATETWIAHQLGLSRPEVRIAVERLERVGLLERSRGKLRPVSDYVLSPDGIPSEAIRNYHRQILDKAKAALDTQALEEREITGACLTVRKRDLKAMKKDVSEFLDLMVSKYAKGSNRTEVYQLEAALFRLSKGEQK